ncbi:MAG: 2OG-Fe(II) oxygenase [Myxococcota bacterium]
MKMWNGRWCQVIDDVLSAARCRAIIAGAESRGFEGAAPAYPPDYRNNDRQICDDASLADQLFAHLRPHLPERLDGEQLVGLNARFRICRYRANQSFTVHQDGAWHPDDRTRSRLTLMLYLNDGDDFIGGLTRFYRSGVKDAPIWRAVRPKAGRLMLFDHLLWHDGQAVRSGTKYILRTDVLYRSTVAHPGHRGYIWAIQRLHDGRLATGGRDRTVRIWSADGQTVQRTWTAHDLSTLALAQGVHGRLWTGSRDRTVAVWDPTGRRLNQWQAHDGAVLALAAVGGRVASAGADGQVRIWDAAGTLIHGMQAHDGWARALAALSDGTLISGGADGAVRRWCVQTGRLLAVLSRGAAPIWSVAGAGPRIFAGDAAGWIRRCGRGQGWRAHDAGVRALCVSGDRIISGGEDDRIHVWAGDTWVHGFQAENTVSALVMHGEAAVISGGYGGRLRRWALASDRPAVIHGETVRRSDAVDAVDVVDGVDAACGV